MSPLTLRIRAFSRFVAVCGCLVSLAGLALRNTGFTAGWALILASGALYLWIAAAPALVISLCLRRWGIAAVSTALLAVGAVQYAPLLIPDESVGGGPQLRVMALNLQFGQADPSQVVQSVRAEGIDVLVTVEMTEQSVVALRRSGLAELLPEQSLDPGPAAQGVGIWSRYPLAAPESVPGFQLGVVRTAVTIPSGPLPILAVHPVSAVSSASDSVEEAERLRTVLASQPAGPVVVAGDFNATWDTLRFRNLRQIGYRDSVTAGGDGLLPTWPTDRFIPPLWGIDHVMARDVAALGQTQVIAIPGTDHKAVAATVTLAD